MALVAVLVFCVVRGAAWGAPPHSMYGGGLNEEVRREAETSVGSDDFSLTSTSTSTSTSRRSRPHLANVTIVTRSGFRPACLNNLQASLAAQSTSEFRQIVSNDADRHGLRLLEEHRAKARHALEIVDLDRRRFWTKGRVQCASSRYLNTLYERVPRDSWIMTLDDDSRLVDPDQILRARRAAARSDPTTDVLLQDAYMWTNRSFRVYPNYTASKIWIDTANVIFHRSAVSQLDFGAACGGDKVGFRRLLDAGYRPVAIRQATPGVWANYAGPAHQRLVDCDVHRLAPGEDRMTANATYRNAKVPLGKHQARAERHQAHLRNHNYKVPKPALVWRGRKRRRRMI